MVIEILKNMPNSASEDWKPHLDEYENLALWEIFFTFLD